MSGSQIVFLAHNDPYGPRLLWNEGRVLGDGTLFCCWFQCVGHRLYGGQSTTQPAMRSGLWRKSIHFWRRLCTRNDLYIFVSPIRALESVSNQRIASALSIALLPFAHSTSEYINADSFLQLERRSGGRPQRTVYPRRLPVNTDTHYFSTLRTHNQ